MRVLTDRHTFELEEKKSRFIAVAAPVESVDAALAALDEIRDDDATHNCFAYRIGDTYRFFDDGEPGGTAGKPILAAIERQGIDRCLVVVIRFFGGIKLGAGGLTRAYGKTASECLRSAPTEEMIPRVRMALHAPFDSIGDLYPVFARHEADKLEETYDERGVAFVVELAEEAVERFTGDVADATRGSATTEPYDENKRA